MDEFNDTTTIKEDLEDCCQRTESEKSLIATNSFWIEGIGLILVSMAHTFWKTIAWIYSIFFLLALSLKSFSNFLGCCTTLVCVCNLMQWADEFCIFTFWKKKKKLKNTLDPFWFYNMAWPSAVFILFIDACQNHSHMYLHTRNWLGCAARYMVL